MRQMYPSLTLISGLFTVCTASTESINSGIKELPAEAWVAQRAAPLPPSELPAEAWVAQRAAPLPPSELPAEAWLAQRAAHWANMYLPGRAPANSTCQKALRAMAESLAGDGTLWAAKFVDSWAKVPDGLYVGNWALEGVFDECISASSPDRSIRGKFCRVSVFDNATAGGQLRGDGGCGGGALGRCPEPQVRLPTRLEPAPSKTYSTCMPDACTELDLQESVSAALAGSSLGVRRVQCQTLDDPLEYTPGDLAFITLLCFFLLLMVSASALDVFVEKTNYTAIAKGGLRFLLPFSAYTNLSKLFQLNTRRSSENITCLHGIRVLSMIWVMYGHQHQATASFSSNVIMMLPKTSGFLYQVIGNAYFSVDTFFFLSGFLVTYVLLRELSRTGRFNVVMFYVHRFIRLIPPIAIATGLFATVACYFVSGPMKDGWEHTRRGCVVNWWKDLVFLNNFFLDEDESGVAPDCLVQAWYLAVDTQLYLVAPLVVLPLHFFEAAGMVWLYLLAIVSVVIPTAITYVYDLEPGFLLADSPGIEFNNKVYITPWCRAGPWLVGVWLGYVFHKQGHKEVVLEKWQVVAGWTTSTLVAFLLVMGLWSYNVVPRKAQYDVMTQLAYAGLSRPAWGAVLAWIIYACHFGYGGPVDGFLSHPSWQPISRVTYSTYLVAMQIQFLIAYSSKAPVYFTLLNVLMQTAAAVVISSVVGVLVSLTAEAPIIGLEKLLLRRPGHGGGAQRDPPPVGEENKGFKGDMEEAPRPHAPRPHAPGEAGEADHSAERGGEGGEAVTKF